MTFIAGFTYADGVLLCADTEYTSTQKLQASKIFPNTYSDGSHSVIVLAGDMMYARMGIQEIEQGLEDLKEPRTYRQMRYVILSVLHALHLQRLYADPDKPTVSYLVGVRPAAAADTHVRFLSTQQLAVVAIRGYDCLGAGSELGHYLIRPKYKKHARTLSERGVKQIAARTFREVKRQITYCGGDTEYVTLTHAGKLSLVQKLT